MLRLKKSEIISMFVGFGYSKAPQWSDQRLADRISALGELIETKELDPSVLKGANKAVYAKMKKATDDDEELDMVEDDEESEDDDDPPPAKAKPAKKKPVAKDDDEEDDEPEDDDEGGDDDDDGEPEDDEEGDEYDDEPPPTKKPAKRLGEAATKAAKAADSPDMLTLLARIAVAVEKVAVQTFKKGPGRPSTKD